MRSENTAASGQSQLDKFKALARELDAGEDEARWTSGYGRWRRLSLRRIRRNWKRWAILFALTAPAMASAQVPRDWGVVGYISNTCADWNAAKAKDSIPTDWSYLTYKVWLSGTLSEFNLARGGSLLIGTNMPGAVGWVDNYCAANPLDLVSVAVSGLVNELLKRQGRIR